MEEDKITARDSAGNYETEDRRAYFMAKFGPLPEDAVRVVVLVKPVPHRRVGELIEVELNRIAYAAGIRWYVRHYHKNRGGGSLLEISYAASKGETEQLVAALEQHPDVIRCGVLPDSRRYSCWWGMDDPDNPDPDLPEQEG